MLLTSSWMVDFLLIFATTLLILYKYFTRNFDYWKKRGVFYIKPIPFFGNFYETITFKKTIGKGLTDLYVQSNDPYFGVFIMDQPLLIVKSPQLVEHILIKDFTYFRNRSMASPKHNPYISNFLVFQQYEEWKRTRSKVNFIFSTGRLRGMFNVALPINDLMTEYLKTKTTIDAKELATQFATEATVLCYFGITSNCFSVKDAEIFQISKRVFQFTFRNAIVQGLYLLRPDWVDLFKLNFMEIHDQNFLIDVFMDVVENRKASKQPNSNAKAMDYIDIIMNTKEKGSLEGTDLVEVLSNTLQFFVAGTETMGAAQSFTLYELAINPHVQNKLRKEVVEVTKKYGGITFDALQEMKYLEFCLFETMRKYVSLQVIDRKAVEDYKVPGTDFVIEKGTTIFIPFHSIHMDEKYYPEPEKYNPDRFINLNINEKGLNFIPFGAGPRICIGERFAMIMSKSMLASMMLTYELSACDKTPIPLELEPKSFTFQSKIGLPLNIKPLKK